MAPSRRKGAGKVAATRKEWKIGDLVLAKVKGFPAWPAAVSDPGKFGYPTDRKKVTVQFFGGSQIAFCHPADVEEFTEEKKLSLLGKRHGKGADFVTAVNEIIDCFDKLKKPDLVSTGNKTEETNIINENNSNKSLAKSVKDEVPEIIVKPLSTNNEETKSEEANSNSVFTETTPASTSYSTRNKTDVTQSRNERRVSARKLRSSSRIDACRFPMPSVSKTRPDRSLRRSKRNLKSPDDSDGRDSIEENDFEAMTVDSDANNGSLESMAVEVETFAENNEGEMGLNDRLDFQTNTVITKKRRNHNRKRYIDDTPVAAAKLEAVVSEPEVMTRMECSSSSLSNDDKLGDEHLPLVKRARVRMGRLSPEKEEKGVSAHKEDKTLKVPEKRLSVETSSSFNHKMSDPDNRESVPTEGDLVNSSLSHASPAEMTHICEKTLEVSEVETFGPSNFKASDPDNRESVPTEGEPANSPSSHRSPVKMPYSWGKTLQVPEKILSVEISGPFNCKVRGSDNKESVPAAKMLHSSPVKTPRLWAPPKKTFVECEAALPPSKRLHRALEAMSAVAEKGSERDSDSSSSFDETSSELSKENKTLIGVGSRPAEVRSNNESGSGVELSEINAKTTVLISDCDKTSCSSNPDYCKELIGNVEGADIKRLKVSPLIEEAPAGVIKSDSPDIDEEKLARFDSNKPGFVMSPHGFYKIEPNGAVKGPGPDSSHMNQKSVLVEEKIAGGSLNVDDTGFQVQNADAEGLEIHQIKHLSLAEEKLDIQRSEHVKEFSPVSQTSNAIPSATPVNVLSNGLYHNRPRSTSISNEDRTVSDAQSPLSLTDNNYLENKSSCSPDVQLYREKAKLAGKLSGKGETLSSFESVIRSLTRTKESIGRATRIAIDCAKYGLATKVVEILAHNLENESSSHKKVDLFFLVDSITQCSRGMKGDGGIYPTAIQAVLPRLLLAAAPPCSSSHDNHRQCLKVLRVWQDRNILPEPIIRHHIRELDALCGSYPTGVSRRSRNERAFDDPIRQMEGMLVDEYGSNSSFQLPGFCMPPMLSDDAGTSDSDGESFEAVTPEHNTENFNGEKTQIPATEKRSHILEAVDGELEMEDVAPCCEVETASNNHYEAPLQPKDVHLARDPPPLPLPPPPPPRPVPPSDYHHASTDCGSYGRDSNLYSSSKNFNSNLPVPMESQSVCPRVKPPNVDPTHHHHHRAHNNKDFESHQMHDRHTSSRASNNSTHTTDTKKFHLPPPHPAPSNQFSYVPEQEIHPRRDIPPPPPPPTHHLNRFHSRNSENGHRHRDRYRHNKFVPRDNIGECWRPPLPAISGPCNQDGARMAHNTYGGPSHGPAVHNNNRWNYPPRPLNNHRQHNSYRPPSDGPVPVANRGSNYWRPPRYDMSGRAL